MGELARVVDGRFACPGCGKRYTWKPGLAGKRARCACGATIVVPAGDDPVATNPIDDAYDFAPPEATAPPPRPRVTPAAAAQSAPPPAGSGVASMGYVAAPGRAEKNRRTRPADDVLVSKPRDVYLPYGLAAAGGLAMLGWAAYELGVDSAGGAQVVSVVAGVITLIKTGVILGLALLFAPKLGISFGDVPSAVRKLIAIVLVSDAALLWFGTVMEATGASRPGWISVREVVIRVVIAAALISTLCHYLFDMDAEETGMFAVPLAFISLVLGFVLKIAAVVVLGAVTGAGAGEAEDLGADGDEGVATAERPAAAPDAGGPRGRLPAADRDAPAGEDAPPAATASPDPAAPAPADDPRPQDGTATAFAETDDDRIIIRRIREGGRFIRDARQWVEREVSRVQRESALVNALYAAGAKKVVFDFEGGRDRRPAKAYVELPPLPNVRPAIFATRDAFRRDNNLPPEPEPAKDLGQRFLVIDMR